jgi:hypothetical protein
MAKGGVQVYQKYVLPFTQGAKEGKLLLADNSGDPFGLHEPFDGAAVSGICCLQVADLIYGDPFLRA